jgi:hypothetical protein
MKVKVEASPKEPLPEVWEGKCFWCAGDTLILCIGISEGGNLDALILSSTVNEWKGKVGKIIRNFTSKNTAEPWYGKVELTFD